MKTARQWKAFYAAERERLGEAGLSALLDRAPTVELPARGALVFPHTRLDQSGELVAAAVLAVLRSGAEEVFALGVLHGAREADAALVERARDGDLDALRQLRRVHGPGVPGDAGHWNEEFSLDNFCALLETAARRAGVRSPRVIPCFPFLVGATPGDLPGFDDLRALLARGVALVATTDPIHHGVGYETPPAECLPREAVATHDHARRTIESSFRQLAAGDYSAFLCDAIAVRSDFRDTGPVLAELLHRRSSASLTATVHSLHLVDYADALQAPQPTWVAAALATFTTAGEIDRENERPFPSVPRAYS